MKEASYAEIERPLHHGSERPLALLIVEERMRSSSRSESGWN